MTREEGITCNSPLPSDGFSRLAISSPVPLFPFPTVPEPTSVWTSSINRTISPALTGYKN